MTTPKESAGRADRVATWMPLYVADYLGDTQHLTLAEHGAYLLLLMAYWRNEGPLPNDDVRLARIVGVGAAEWAALKVTLKVFFEETSEGLRHGRVDAELARARENRAFTKARSERANDAKKAKAASRLSAAAQAGEPDQATSKVTLKETSKVTLKDTTSPSPSPSPTESIRGSSPDGDDSPVPGSAVIATPVGGIPVPVDEPQLATGLYNEMARRANARAGDIVFPIALRPTAQRRTLILQRLRECGGIDGFKAVLDTVEASDFLTGRSGRAEGHANWRADLGWIVKAENFAKIREGRYSGRALAPAHRRTMGDVAREWLDGAQTEASLGD